MSTSTIPDVLIRPVSHADLAYQDSPFSPSLATLVVVDRCITDYTMLVDGIASPAAILILDPQQDGIDQITTAILSSPCFQSLHLISHGAPGCLYLGNRQLSLETLDNYATQLSSWFSHAHTQLLLYGCNVAAGDAGVEFIERLQCLTGAAIAASTTPVGNATLGGNWELDVTTHEMTVAPCFQETTLATYPAVLATGSLDTSFGNNGLVLEGSNSGLSYAMAAQSDGKLLVTSGNPYSLGLSGGRSTLIRYTSDGSRDTVFADSQNSGDNILVQPDGKIIVAGDAVASIPIPSFPGAFAQVSSFGVTRYNSDGSLDTSFGNGGRVITNLNIGANYTVFNEHVGAVLQSDGKILLSGFSYTYASGTTGPVALAALVLRYNSDGSLDTSFGNGIQPGVSVISTPGEQTYAHSIALQPNGQIVLTGGSAPSSTTVPTLDLWRLDTNGTLLNTTKTSFTSSINYFQTSSSDLSQLAIQADGRIVVKNRSLIRFNSDFTLDTSFGTNGSVAVSGNNNLVLQPDGKIMVLGTGLERYDSNGSLDSSFGNGGRVSIDFLGEYSGSSFFSTEVSDFVLQPDGKIVVGGRRNGPMPIGRNFAMTRYFGITNETNQAPTDLNLSSTSIAENLPLYTIVGTLSTTDPDVRDGFNYSLVTGSGSTDNASFRVVGDTLQTTSSFNFESKSTYSIRVRTTDNSGASFEKPLTITIQNVNEAPVVGTAIANQTTTVGTAFSYTVPASTFADPDGDALTVSVILADGTALPSWLSFNPTTRTFSGTPGSASVGSLSLRVQATDPGGLSTNSVFSLTVNASNPNQAPTNLTLSSTSIAENLASGAIVGTFTTTDPNPVDTFTYALVSGTGSTDNAAFTIVGNTLRTNQSFNFEEKSSYSIRVRTSDGKGGTFERVLTISVLDRNDAPIVATPLTNRTARIGRAFRYTIPTNTFFDEDVEADDENDSLTLRATLNDGRALPTWLRFNTSTGTFSGTPSASSAGTLNIMVTASDRAGASVSSTFKLVVR